MEMDSKLQELEQVARLLSHEVKQTILDLAQWVCAVRDRVAQLETEMETLKREVALSLHNGWEHPNQS